MYRCRQIHLNDYKNSLEELDTKRAKDFGWAAKYENVAKSKFHLLEF